MERPAPGWCPRIRSDVDWVEVEGDIVIIDAHDGLHVLTGAAALIWPFFDGRTSLADVAADVAAAFGVATASAQEDLVSFAMEATTAGLLAVDQPQQAQR